jgi:hypothetical protein
VRGTLVILQLHVAVKSQVLIMMRTPLVAIVMTVEEVVFEAAARTTIIANVVHHDVVTAQHRQDMAMEINGLDMIVQLVKAISKVLHKFYSNS